MPKENKKRGRRMKRKLEEEPGEDNETQHEAKRRRSDDAAAHEDEAVDKAGEDIGAAYPAGEQQAFFGMLDEGEQEYFRHADDLLEANNFESDRERAALVEQIYHEADGKELKIAQSQSCSRILERLIQVSNASQLKKLFQKFSGNFLTLMTHRFSSHCCESLYTYAAPFVSAEVLEPQAQEKPVENGNSEDEIYVSMENLFLHTLAELDGNVAFMMSDRYASHSLRALLLVLSGEPISKTIDKQASHSKTKERFANAPIGDDSTTPQRKTRAIPASFSTGLEKLISGSTSGFDTATLRALATHQYASPTLQLLLKLEMTHYGKQRAKDEKSILRTLIPDDPFTADCESAAFLSGLAYDTVGAHLVEAIVRWAPAKLFKKLYSVLFKDRLASYARNEIATYIDCRILERLGHDDLMDAHEILAPLIPSLVEKQWTALTRTLIERCVHRKIDTQAIAVQIDEAFHGADGLFDVQRMLFLADTEGNTAKAKDSGETYAAAFSQPVGTSKVHFNILAQAMLIVPGSLSALLLDSLTTCKSEDLLKMAHDHIVTRTLQQALTTQNASIIQRRKLIQPFYGNFGEMALDKAASHVVDCVWEGTHGLAFIRERIAEELAENEAALRESAYGRMVWRNWKMDIYKRRRGEWVRYSKVKASNDGFQSFSELDDASKGTGNDGRPAGGKTPLQIARERHAREKKQREEEGNRAPGRRSARTQAASATAAGTTSVAAS